MIRLWGFLVLVTNSDTKENVQDLHPLKCLTQQGRPSSSLTLLPKARVKRKQIFQARCYPRTVLRVHTVDG